MLSSIKIKLMPLKEKLNLTYSIHLTSASTMSIIPEAYRKLRDLNPLNPVWGDGRETLGDTGEPHGSRDCKWH